MEALNDGVNSVLLSVNMQNAFNGVWGRLGRVLKLIRDEKGGNKTVESMRGKKGAELDTPFEYGEDSTGAAAAAAPEQQTPPEVIDLLHEEEDELLEEEEEEEDDILISM